MEENNYKDSLDDIEAGDTVVMQNSYGGWSKHTVDRVTKTQIIVGTTKFRRDDGFEVTGIRVNRKDRIFPPIKVMSVEGQGSITYLQVLERSLEEKRLDNMKTPYVGYILNITDRQLRKLDLHSLEKAARSLGYKD